MSEKPRFEMRPNRINTRVSRLGDKDLREIGWVAPDGRDLLHVQHHADSCYWRVVFPLVDGRVPLGSAPTLRAAYREAYRQHRLLRRTPERVARSRANALRTAWKYRQRARRYAETVNRLTRELKTANAVRESQARIIGELKVEEQRLRAVSDGRDAYEHSLSKQRDEAKEKADRLQRELDALRLAQNRLTHEMDGYRKQLGLPTSDDLVVRGSRPVYPLRSQSEETQNA